MKKYILFLILLLISINLKAISISATPDPGIVNQNIRFDIFANFDYIDFICPIEINFGDSSNWYTVGNCSTSNCYLSIDYVYNTPGYYTVTVQSNCPDTPPAPPDPAYLSVRINCTSLSITSPTILPEGHLNDSYNYQIQSTGGWAPYTFSLAGGSLPTGLNLSTNGVISGIPTSVGSYNFTINLKDSCPTGVQNVSQNFTLNITTTCPPLSIVSPSNLPDGFLNQSYNYQIQTNGGFLPLTFALSSGNLPKGLSLNSNGLISGIPTIPGIFNFSVNVKDSCPLGSQNVEKDFSIKVNCNGLSITSPSNLPGGKMNEFYSYQIQTNGGFPPINFELSNGQLPPGLTLSTQGIISGIPNLSGVYSFSIKALDSCPISSQSTIKAFNLEITGFELNLNVLPPSFYIPKGEGTSLSINYQFNSNQSKNLNLISEAGYFYANGELIYENNKTLNAVVQNGNGFVSENISVPFKIVERVISKNLNYFIYKRIFRYENFEVEGILNLFITTEGSSNFMIRRAELFFEDGRVEATVPRNFDKLKSYALISFVGSGILDGYWEVDGRIIGRVYEILNYGDNKKIETPPIPQLPTFEPGIHKLSFVILSPKIEISTVSIFYFVNTEEESIAVIKILRPEKEKVDPSGILFEWENLRGVQFYLIEFYEEGKKEPIFSAYTKENFYKLKEEILKTYFINEDEYYFKIFGFDEKEKKIGMSNLQKIMFKK